MARPKRNKAERERDLAHTAELVVQRWSQARIAEALGGSQQMIAYDLRIIQRRWQAQATANLEEHIGQSLDVLDAVEREAWTGWSRSLEPRIIRSVQRKSEAQDGDDSQTLVKSRTENQAGDPHFLQVIVSSIDRRCRLLGLEHIRATLDVKGGLSDETVEMIKRRILGLYDEN